jgi:hypothetical protein
MSDMAMTLAVDGPLVKVIDATKLNVLDANAEPTLFCL